jgi:tetratricopeptide (TPR) repeat protein
VTGRSGTQRRRWTALALLGALSALGSCGRPVVKYTQLELPLQISLADGIPFGLEGDGGGDTATALCFLSIAPPGASVDDSSRQILAGDGGIAVTVQAPGVAYDLTLLNCDVETKPVWFAPGLEGGAHVVARRSGVLRELAHDDLEFVSGSHFDRAVLARAVARLEESIRLDNRAVTHAYLADAYAASGDAARSFSERALAAGLAGDADVPASQRGTDAPRAEGLREDYAVNLAVRGRREDATALLERALHDFEASIFKGRPRRPDPYDLATRGVLLDRLGRRAQAIADFKAVIDSRDVDANIRFLSYWTMAGDDATLALPAYLATPLRSSGATGVYWAMVVAAMAERLHQAIPDLHLQAVIAEIKERSKAIEPVGDPTDAGTDATVWSAAPLVEGGSDPSMPSSIDGLDPVHWMGTIARADGDLDWEEVTRRARNNPGFLSSAYFFRAARAWAAGRRQDALADARRVLELGLAWESSYALAQELVIAIEAGGAN